MRDLGKSFVQFFVSLQLTVVLLALSAILVLAATINQTELGVWGIQQKWFRSLVVLHNIGGIPFPIFPGGYFIGGLLFLNLIAAHVYRFKLTWKKSGLFLTHLGILMLLVGEFLTGILQDEYQMRLDEGETKNYSESPHFNELAIINATDPEWDDVVVVPEKLLKRGAEIQHHKLPFRAVVRDYYPNASLAMRNQAPNAAPSPATVGVGPQIVAEPIPVTYKQDERNMPAAFVELVGPNGSIGTLLVSPQLEMQTLDFEGKTWRIGLRFERNYTPFTLSLIKFSHDKYPGTDIPKNFSSRVRLQTDDGKTDREALIYMNNPLRFQGLTFYQQGFENNDRTTILQVVRNPSWVMPYAACAVLFLGLVVHFGISLVTFASKRSRKAAALA